MAINPNIDVERYSTDFQTTIKPSTPLEMLANSKYEGALRTGASVKLPLDATSYTVQRSDADGSIGSWTFPTLTQIDLRGKELTWTNNHKINKQLTHEDVRNISADSVGNTAKEMAYAIRRDVDAYAHEVLQAAELADVDQDFSGTPASYSQAFWYGSATNILSYTRGGIPEFTGGDADPKTVYNAIIALLTALWDDNKVGPAAEEGVSPVALAMHTTPFSQLQAYVATLGGADTFPLRYVNGQWMSSLFGAFDIMVSDRLDKAAYSVTGASAGDFASSGGKEAYPMYAVYVPKALTRARDFAKTNMYPFGYMPEHDNMIIRAQVQTTIAVEDIRYLYRGLIRAEA